MILQTTPFDTAFAGIVLLLGRVLFGGILAFTGINHFMQTEQMAGYAEAKGVPAAGLMVPFTGGMLVVGGLAIVLGVYPIVGAGALALFLLVSTPLMHDFWNAPEEQQQTEMTQFLKNVSLLGGSLVFLALAGVEWPYSLGLGLL
ncbi:DoxX family protein [Halomarina litorea]|uniref:DoxX family protein n=1 Tax=Halomarina litorea TaxID=2961595 RepID=UPI0020C45A04|nr:DoxX family protein [Halomarina sp. BCD28]